MSLLRSDTSKEEEGEEAAAEVAQAITRAVHKEETEMAKHLGRYGFTALFFLLYSCLLYSSLGILQVGR